MRELSKQCASAAGAAFAGACCLGVSGALSILSALGAGFLIHDVVLIPLYLGLMALSVWLLHRSTRPLGNPTPFRAGLAGATIAFIALWILPALVYAGLAVLVASSLWSYRLRRHRQIAANDP